MNKQDFEADVSQVLAFRENHGFEVYMKGAKISAEEYKIVTDDLVILYSHNTVIAVVSIPDIIGIG